MARTKSFDEQQLADQLVALFRERGFRATSIRDIVTALGISSSSLYATVGDKDALFMFALRRNSEREVTQLQELFADDAEPLDTIKFLVEDFIVRLVAEEIPHGSLTLKAAVEFGMEHPRISGFLRSHYETLTALLANYLQNAHDAARLSLAESAHNTARYLLGGLYTLSLMRRLGATRDQLESYARMMLAVFQPATP